MTDSNPKIHRSDDGTASPARPKSAGGAGKSRRKRQPSRTPAQDAQLSNSEATGPETPPRAPKSRNMKTPGADSHNKRGNQNRSMQRRGSALKEGISQDATGAPYDVPRPETSQATPARPMQVYAGPNFHASPAPSSLPIPKMFSKSMPQVNDKSASLKAIMQEDLSDDSSFSGDGSPTLRNSILASEEQKRDVSPLDILFKADQEERALRQGSAGPSSTLHTPSHDRRARSSSPASGPTVPPPQPGRRQMPAMPQQHSYDNAVFSMDSDGEVFGSRPSTAAATPPLQPDPAAQAKAKTEALKQLLRFSPSPHLSPAQGPPSRGSSGAFTPPIYDGRNSQGMGHRAAPHTTGPPVRFYSPQPAPPYKQPLHELNSNASPIEARHHSPFSNPSNLGRPPLQPSGAGPAPGRAQATTQFSAKDALKANMGDKPQAGSSTEEMEAQLRKILKLDGGLSSTGVQL